MIDQHRVEAPAAASALRARQHKYEVLADDAIAHHQFWRMLWAELARDYNAALANVFLLWGNVDAHFSHHSEHRSLH